MLLPVAPPPPPMLASPWRRLNPVVAPEDIPSWPCEAAWCCCCCCCCWSGDMACCAYIIDDRAAISDCGDIICADCCGMYRGPDCIIRLDGYCAEPRQSDQEVHSVLLTTPEKQEPQQGQPR
uniref:Uncharacterized protein n=1 Tax=Triticum urartu TaxID=4572 RepID=A0A8R7Q253_TRIUA